MRRPQRVVHADREVEQHVDGGDEQQHDRQLAAVLATAPGGIRHGRGGALLADLLSNRELKRGAALNALICWNPGSASFDNWYSGWIVSMLSHLGDPPIGHCMPALDFVSTYTQQWSH